jgi:hypothetical protein
MARLDRQATPLEEVPPGRRGIRIAAAALTVL